MQNNIHLPAYDELAETLSSVESPFQPADVHGLMCGIICANPDDPNSRWEKIIFDSKKDFEILEPFEHLYSASYELMNQFSFEFNLLLPSDDVDINVRAEALGLWCQGFLTGLQQAAISLKDHTNIELTDAIKDITEIAQISYGDIPSTDEDETAYFELVEYIRLIVLMIFQECKKSFPSSFADQNNALH
ncbi:MAG: UPF0149 family protein [Gammaproteobacteria bacterium]|nr:UPF0149 family protein [Gammaproteobacteria bacterium]